MKQNILCTLICRQIYAKNFMFSLGQILNHGQQVHFFLLGKIEVKRYGGVADQVTQPWVCTSGTCFRVSWNCENLSWIQMSSHLLTFWTKRTSWSGVNLYGRFSIFLKSYWFVSVIMNRDVIFDKLKTCFQSSGIRTLLSFCWCLINSKSRSQGRKLWSLTMNFLFQRNIGI